METIVYIMLGVGGLATISGVVSIPFIIRDNRRIRREERGQLGKLENYLANSSPEQRDAVIYIHDNSNLLEQEQIAKIVNKYRV